MRTEQSPTVMIVGLGYVGLTLGVALAARGLKVSGIERRPEVVKLTNEGTPHFSEVGLDAALASVVKSGHFFASTSADDMPPADYYIITVGTPLKPGTYEPRLDMIEQATNEVAQHMAEGATVILRSTVRIGTTNQIVRPVLERTGKHFYLAMCPERTLEGDALRELKALPQIIGGASEVAADRAASLFSRLTHTVIRVADPETAEMIKLVDNTSRDVRFAFANEVARACDAIGINAQQVIQYGKLGYSRTDVAMPGLVGGPCLEKDPHILLASLAPSQIELEITAASRKVNERQPAETVSHIIAQLQRRGPAPYRVAVAGIAFKGRPETDDLRGSMSLKVLSELQKSDLIEEIRVYDKVVSPGELQGLGPDLVVMDDVYDVCSGVDALVIANNHPMFENLEIETVLQSMKPDGFIYDYWNSLAKHPPEVVGGRYYTVGNIAGKS